MDTWFYQAGFLGFILGILWVLDLAFFFYQCYLITRWRTRFWKYLKTRGRGSETSKKNHTFCDRLSDWSQEHYLSYRYIFHWSIQLAPMLGLLGTILGLIDSTAGIVKQDSGYLFLGVGKALSTTALGLLISLMNTLFDFFFEILDKRWNRRLNTKRLQNKTL